MMHTDGFDLHDAVILIVDDEQPNLDLLCECLSDEGYLNVTGIADPREVVGLVDSLHPDLILLDLHMPWMDGFALLQAIGGRTPPEEYLPMLVLTADATEATKRRALSEGAKDFLAKPFDLSEVTLRIRNLLETRMLHQAQRAARKAAEDAGRRASCLASASQVLASSFDYHTTLSLLCASLIPQLADYCIVDVMTEDGSIDRVGAAHRDHTREPLVRATHFADPKRLPPDHPSITAITQGRRTLAQEITPEMISIVVADEVHLQALEALAPRSLIAVPIEDSRHIHGALVLAYAESGRRYELEDLELAIEIARRAALTIDNAALFDQAQQASRARDELLAVVAHDLRNPLSTVKMGASMLSEEATTDAQRRHADLVGRAADRMHRLIEDLLDVTRIQSGKLRVDLGAHPVSSLVSEAVAMLTPLAGSRNIALTAEIDRRLPPVIMDPSRILQVISNILGNALKFTPEGGKVRLACDTDGREMKFIISDTGPGIPPDQIPHIFGKLWQASDRDRRGIGLGLSIVRGIIDAHGGRVWVESEPGKGTSFYFTLPLASAGEPVQEAPIELSESAPVS